MPLCIEQTSVLAAVTAVKSNIGVKASTCPHSYAHVVSMAEGSDRLVLSASKTAKQ